jgi:hypothetical protein
LKTTLALRKEKKYNIIGQFGDMTNPSVADYETKYMSETSKKSCSYNKFVEYWKRRSILVHQNTQLYVKAWFRQTKFTVYCRAKGSVDRFCNKIKSTFVSNKNKNQKISKWLTRDNTGRLEIIKENASQSKLVIGYGNWGRNPNMVHQTPTPGIGIRRIIHKVIPTVTINEHNTSNTCPCCQTVQSMEKPFVGNKKIQKHHLLRCKNETCHCRLWNRNIVGGLNILFRFHNKLSDQKDSLITLLAS